MEAGADFTAGGDFHPALKTSYFVVQSYYTVFLPKNNPQNYHPQSNLGRNFR